MDDTMRGLPSPLLLPRSASWPLSAIEQRYNLRPIWSRRRHPPDPVYAWSSSASSVSSSNDRFLDEPDDESANVWGSSSSSTDSQSSGKTGSMETTVARRRPSTLAVLARFLGLGENIVLINAVFFVVGMLLGTFLTWCCAMAATTVIPDSTTPTTAPTTAQHHHNPQLRYNQPQDLMGRLATDLQILHWDALQAFGVASPLGAAASDDDVKACLKTVGKKYRYLAGVWHPDRCVYEEAGLLAEWQCNELYKTMVAKKDLAFYGCLGTERRLSEASQGLWRKSMEKENNDEDEEW